MLTRAPVGRENTSNAMGHSPRSPQTPSANPRSQPLFGRRPQSPLTTIMENANTFASWPWYSVNSSLCAPPASAWWVPQSPLTAAIRSNANALARRTRCSTNGRRSSEPPAGARRRTEDERNDGEIPYPGEVGGTSPGSFRASGNRFRTAVRITGEAPLRFT